MEKALPEAYSRQKDVHALHLQQRERHRIFEELNESLAQTLSSLCIHLSLLGTHVEESPQAKLYLCQSQALAQQALGEIRRMMDPCQPAVPDDCSLSEVLQSLVWFSKSIGMQIDFHSDESLPRLLLPLETILYKLVQEILSHALQHAPTAPVSLYLTVVDNTVQLTLSFSDILLAPLFSQSAGQAVIFCMQEWVGELGGSFVFRRKVEREAEICANLPLLLRERDERYGLESYGTGYLE